MSRFDVSDGAGVTLSSTAFSGSGAPRHSLSFIASFSLAGQFLQSSAAAEPK